MGELSESTWAQLKEDLLTYGFYAHRDGERINPMTMYKDLEDDNNDNN